MAQECPEAAAAPAVVFQLSRLAFCTHPRAEKIGNALGPRDFESLSAQSKFNNFKHLGVQDAAKRDISCPKTAT